MSRRKDCGPSSKQRGGTITSVFWNWAGRPAPRAADDDMIVDCYAHASCRKYQPVERLIKEMRDAGVDAAVLVQPLGDYDNGYLQEVIGRYPRRFQAVGLVEPGAASLPTTVCALVRNGISGIRATA